MVIMKKVILKDAVYINPRRIINKGDLTPYIPMSNLEENKRKIQKVEEREYEGSGSRFMNGDILFARITPCLENGKTAFVDVLSENEVAHGSTEFIVFRGKEGVTDNLFVYYLARSDRFRRYAIKSMTGTSGRQRVQIGSIENYEFQLPSLDKQKRIAHILGTLDDKIELNQRMNQTLEAIARAVFKSWFVDFDPVRAKMAGEPYPLPDAVMALFPDELVESELGMIPKGWEVGKLGDFIKIFDSERIPLSRREREKRKGDYPYYGATKIFDYVDDFIFDGIFVLMGEDGSVITKKGYPVLQYVWGKFWANNHAHVLQGKNGFSTEYLYISLSQKNISPFVTGAVQPKLNQNNMKKIKVIKPNVKVLNVFEGYIQNIFKFIRYNQDILDPISNMLDLYLEKITL